MPRVDAVRSEIQRLVRVTPFHPFALNLDNGDRAIIGYPENIAFDPDAKEGMKGWSYFVVIANGTSLSSSFESVTSVALVDRGQSAE